MGRPPASPPFPTPPGSPASHKTYAPGEATHNPAATDSRNSPPSAAGSRSEKTASEIKNEMSDMAEVKFNKFMKDYNKVYRSPEEKLMRFRIFKENLEEARRGNEAHRRKDGTPGKVFGVSKFADLTEEEFRVLHLAEIQMPPSPILSDSDSDDGQTPKSPPRKKMKTKGEGSGTGSETAHARTARSPTVGGEGSFAPTNRTRRQENPSYWSYTDEEYYPKVGPHQGNCMACIEVALAGALAILNSKRVNRDKGLLAAQQLLDCVPGNSCQVASNYTALMNYLMGEYLCPNAWYPYRGVTQSCRENYVRRKGLVTVQNFEILPNNDETEAILLSKIQESPFLVSLKGEFLRLYTGPDPIENCPNVPPNHAGALVGYGESEDEVDYYLIRNTWGPNFGVLDGHVRVKRGTCTTHWALMGFAITVHRDSRRDSDTRR